MSKKDGGDEFFDLLLFLVTSARVAIDEPKRYGSFRLFMGYSKLLELARRSGAPKAGLYEDLLTKLEEKKAVVASSSSTGTPEYADLLDDLIDAMAKEV